jgi:hypothetical protein
MHIGFMWKKVPFYGGTRIVTLILAAAVLTIAGDKTEKNEMGRACGAYG